MKRIALTQRLVKNDSYREIREALDINWGAFIQQAGFEPLALPVKYDFRKLRFDGALLTGGNDLAVVSGDETDKLRDDFEYALLDFCITKKIPVLGVCRGMQLINVYFDGSLKRTANHAGVRHRLDNGMEVNSFHNFSADRLGNGLEVTARSGDGTIEMIRHNEHKICAQMYHPERYDPFCDYDLRFLRSFFNE
jgi:putative glutamine amidotransferase